MWLKICKIHWCFLRKAGCHMWCLIWCVWSLGSLTILHSPTYGPWEHVGRFWQGSTATHMPLAQGWSPFIRAGHALQLSMQFWEEAPGVVRKEKYTRLISQISRIIPGDQRGEQCHRQTALTPCFSYFFFNIKLAMVECWECYGTFFIAYHF